MLGPVVNKTFTVCKIILFIPLFLSISHLRVPSPSSKVKRRGASLVHGVARRLVAEQQAHHLYENIYCIESIELNIVLNHHLLVAVETRVVKRCVTVRVSASDSSLDSAERGKRARFLWLDAAEEKLWRKCDIARSSSPEDPLHHGIVARPGRLDQVLRLAHLLFSLLRPLFS